MSLSREVREYHFRVDPNDREHVILVEKKNKIYDKIKKLIEQNQIDLDAVNKLLEEHRFDLKITNKDDPKKWLSMNEEVLKYN
jgi:REP element-mobilizing transposase RayT